MDVGFYLGELLMQQGEVSVPGLGYFVQVRNSGYYNDAERKFYPPYHQAQFDVQSIEDDSLAEYIANKKNISIASSRYFCEKYVTTLKQQAAITEVQIGNLGWFYTDLSELTFKPAEKIIDDTIFYGFEPISISKVGDVQPIQERRHVELDYTSRFTQSPVVPKEPERDEPAFEAPAMATYETPLPGEAAYKEPKADQRASTYQTAEQGISPEFFEPTEEDEAENRGPLKLILVSVIVLMFIGMAVFAVYRYQPDTFARIAFWKKEVRDTTPIEPKKVVTPVIIDTPVIDTTGIDTLTTQADSVVSTPVPNQNTTVTTQPVAKKQVISSTPVTANTAKQTPAAKTTIVTPPTIIRKTTIISPPKSSAAISTVPITAATTPAKTTSTKIRSSNATGTHRFEVYVSPACKDMAQANRLMAKLRKKGLDPRLVTDAPGPLIHISIGNFKTATEAKAFAVKAQETGKVQGDAYPNEIIPQ